MQQDAAFERTGWRAVHALLLVSLLATPATTWAVPLTWTIDSSLSSLSMAVPDQSVTIDSLTATIQFRNQSGGNAGPWNVGNTAPVAGTIATDYVDGTSIQFLSIASDIYAPTSGNYRPNPAAFNPGAINASNPEGQFSNSSTSPGVFGGRVRANLIITVDAAYFNFYEVSYTLDSSALGITAGSFAADALSFGFEEVVAGFDGINTIVGQPIPDVQAAIVTGFLAANLALGGTVTSPDPVGNPLLRRLTIPIDTDFALDLGDGLALSSTVSGTIVAFATLSLPEPGMLVLLGVALALQASRRLRARA